MELKAVSTLVIRGFLVWSWIGLLSAYIGTSALFVSQLYSNWREGIQAFRFSASAVLMSVTLAQLIPVYILVLAWLSFYRYSLTVFAAALTEDDSPDAKTLFANFRRSLLYLMTCWLIALAFALLPIALQILPFP